MSIAFYISYNFSTKCYNMEMIDRYHNDLVVIFVQNILKDLHIRILDPLMLIAHQLKYGSSKFQVNALQGM